MKLKLSILIIVIFGFSQFSKSYGQTWSKAKTSKIGVLNVRYFENSPFAYSSNNEAIKTGIEIDIIYYFVKWLAQEKEVFIELKFIPYSSYETFLASLKTEIPNTIGAGATAINEIRKKEYLFSSPYLKNISVLVSSGFINSAQSPNDLKFIFGDLTPVTIKGSIHHQHLIDFQKQNDIHSEFIFVESPKEVLKYIKQSGKYYGYVDIINYWAHVKSDKTYIKMHRSLNIEDESFAYMFPAASDWNLIFNEFLDSGFGFTATRDYRKILEKHLGYEIIRHVELD